VHLARLPHQEIDLSEHCFLRFVEHRLDRFPIPLGRLPGGLQDRDTTCEEWHCQFDGISDDIGHASVGRLGDRL
jgi:hypothetical protein